MGLGDDMTPFPGNMALGAIGDEASHRHVGRGHRARRCAPWASTWSTRPACDVASNPDAPAIGHPLLRRRSRSRCHAMRRPCVRGLHDAGVAATAKHFPGKGDIGVDATHGLPVVAHGRERLESIELVPFRGAIEAGVDVVMSAHIEVPVRDRRSQSSGHALQYDPERPPPRRAAASMASPITDALDMKALPQAEARGPAVVRAIKAGVDLLLCVPDEEARRLRMEDELRRASAIGLSLRGPRWHESLRAPGRAAALAREHRPPDLRVVRSAEHRRAGPRAGASLDHPRAQRPRAPAAAPAGRRARACDHAGAAGPHAGRHLEDGGPGPDRRDLASSPERRRHRGRPSADRRGDRRRCVTRPRAPTCSSLGTISASLDPGQAALVNALLGTGVPIVTGSRCERRRTWRHIRSPRPRLQLWHPPAVDGGALRSPVRRRSPRRTAAGQRFPACTRAATGSGTTGQGPRAGSQAQSREAPRRDRRAASTSPRRLLETAARQRRRDRALAGRGARSTA